MNLDKSHWETVRFDDVVRQVKTRVDPFESKYNAVLKGEHVQKRDFHIREHVDKNELGYLGPAFHMEFDPGHILYVSRNPHLMKVGYPDFGGICANTTFVMESNSEEILRQDLIPFIMHSDSFIEHSITHGRGSVNPYVNWKDIACYEFLLPPKDQQAKLAELLWAADAVVERGMNMVRRLPRIQDSILSSNSAELIQNSDIKRLEEIIEVNRPITYGILKPGKSVEGGIPVIKVRDYPEGEIILNGLLRTSQEIELAYKRSRLKPGDILISIRGTMGRVAEVPDVLDGANITQDTARLSIDPSINSRFVRYLLESEYVQSQIRVRITGLAVKGINLGELRKIKVPIPPIEQQVHIAQEIDCIRASISNQEANLEKSRQLLKSLINEIFSQPE